MNIVQKQRQPKKPLIPVSWRKPMALAACSLVCVAALGYGALQVKSWFKKHPAKPAENAKAVDVAKYVASDSFDKMKLSEKETLLEKLRPQPGQDPRETMKDLSENERHAVFEKMMQVREAKMKKTAKEYFSLPPEQREAWMATFVAEQDKRRAEMRERFRQMREQRQQSQSQGQGRSQGQSQGAQNQAPPPPPPF